MDEKLDLQEPAPEQPAAAKPAPPPKLTAPEAFKKYGLRSLLLLGLVGWFGYDGWFNKDPKMQEHLGFNRIGTGLFGVMLLYALVMFISAAITVQREKNNPPPAA